MSETHTYTVTIQESSAPEAGKSEESEKKRENEDLAKKRENYFFSVREKNTERRQTATLLNGEYSNLLKLLTSLSMLGIGAMLFKSDNKQAFTIAYALSLTFMSLSLLFAALSYLFSIRSLSAWLKELNDLEKTYEEMQQIPNDLLHFCMVLSGAFFVASGIAFLCYVAK